MSDKKSLDFFVGNQRLITDEHIDLEIKEVHKDMLSETDQILKDNIKLILNFQYNLAFNKATWNTVAGRFIAAHIKEDMNNMMQMSFDLSVINFKRLDDIDYEDYLKLRELYMLVKVYDIEKYKVK